MLFENLTTAFGFFLFVFVFISFGTYLRITRYLHYIDAGLENPPARPRLGEKLRAYRDFCRDRDRKPVLLTVFTIGVIGAFLCWLPLPWLIFVK